MKKDAYYFPHFSNARNDSKLMRIRRIFGIEGYGIYFMLLEILRDQQNFKYPLEGVEDLAFDWHIGKEKILSIINDFGLFIIDENEFFSPKLIVYLSPYIEKSEKARASVNKRWENAKALQQKYETNTDVLPTNNESNTSKVKQSKVKQSKVKQSKVKESKVKDINVKAPHSFENSIYHDYSVFEKSIDEKLKGYDLEFYHEIAKGYSKSKGAKYIDWMAAIRNWIRRDVSDGKPRVKKPQGNDETIKAERLKKITEAMDKLNNKQNAD